jgi:predicted site-specific integrase-resolvase
MLGVHQRTLYQWEEKGLIETIRTPGGMRLYNVHKFKLTNGLIKDDTDDDIVEGEEMNICYCRVSSQSQKDDLARQIAFMKQKFPDYTIITDIGSGLNLNKRGIRKIIDLAISGKVKNLVVAYKDRLTRFGFELIESFINDYSGGTVTVLFNKENIDAEAEIVQDIMSILNVYMAKINGLRRYKKK